MSLHPSSGEWGIPCPPTTTHTHTHPLTYTGEYEVFRVKGHTHTHARTHIEAGQVDGWRSQETPTTTTSQYPLEALLTKILLISYTSFFFRQHQLVGMGKQDRWIQRVHKKRAVYFGLRGILNAPAKLYKIHGIC